MKPGYIISGRGGGGTATNGPCMDGGGGEGGSPGKACDVGGPIG